MDDETKTLITIIRHINLVRFNLNKIAHRLKEKATVHDSSKYSIDEFEGFKEINRIAREHPFGSKEYKDSIKNNQAVALHYSRNTHHPEHYQDGIDGMNLLDIIEMVADWKAASDTYGLTTFKESLEIQKGRYKLTSEQWYMINKIAECLINE